MAPWRVLAISFVGTCGCAGNSVEPDAPEAEIVSGQAACFRIDQVTGFRALDRSNLIVYAPTRSSAYHVQIRPPAREINFADRIAFDTRTTRICGYAGESVIFDSGGMGRHYFVTSVRRVDAEDIRSLADQFSGDIEVEPSDDSGAEIERDIDED